MVWLTLRQHRLVLATVVLGAIVLAVATVIIVDFGQRTRIELGVDSCRPTPFTNLNCYELDQEWRDRIGYWRYIFLAFLVVPAVVASYVGGPLFARELERGTHRLVLTQTISRLRWAATKLGVVLAVALAAGAVLTLVGGRSRELMSGTFGPSGQRPWDAFDLEGPALLGFMVFGVAAAAFIGAWQKRILTGMFVGLLVFGLVRLGVGQLRPQYETPVAVKLVPSIPVTSLAPFTALTPLTPLVPADAWVVGYDAVDGAGRPVPAERVRALIDEFGRAGCRAGPLACDSVAYLNQRDVYQRQLYQPADRYWRFQAIEGAIYLALTILLVTLTLLIVKRRDA
ncbi:MAG TPA: hypothetical protein VGR87_08155 [Candidatus Limnocylindria bacterium]|jgi:hypothetical protein|nr:hypothetical protein [Candidatus Limnocylindria bacterium]